MRHTIHLSGDEVINVAFGLAAFLLTVCMIWQAAKYAARHDHLRHPNTSFSAERVLDDSFEKTRDVEHGIALWPSFTKRTKRRMVEALRNPNSKFR